MSGVLLEMNINLIEDTCWLHPQSNAQHIKLPELDVMIKGVNLAKLWKAKILHLKNNSLCVYYWLTNITGKARVITKAMSEMLKRRWVETFLELVKEYSLVLSDW